MIDYFDNLLIPNVGASPGIVSSCSSIKLCGMQNPAVTGALMAWSMQSCQLVMPRTGQWSIWTILSPRISPPSATNGEPYKNTYIFKASVKFLEPIQISGFNFTPFSGIIAISTKTYLNQMLDLDSCSKIEKRVQQPRERCGDYGCHQCEEYIVPDASAVDSQSSGVGQQIQGVNMSDHNGDDKEQDGTEADQVDVLSENEFP
ncbi:unnamed protein product, partial [Nesidiocoris tenuis]